MSTSMKLLLFTVAFTSLEEQQKVLTVIIQAHRSVAKHQAQLWRPLSILSNGHQRFLPPW